MEEDNKTAALNKANNKSVKKPEAFPKENNSNELYKKNNTSIQKKHNSIKKSNNTNGTIQIKINMLSHTKTGVTINANGLYK